MHIIMIITIIISKEDTLPMLPSQLHQFAFFPTWNNHLADLARMALPEPWAFRSGFAPFARCSDYAILERLVNATYYALVVERANVPDEAAANEYIHISQEWACFNTGLLSQHYQKIYAVFQRNKREGVVPDWFFKGWHDESAPYMRHVSEPPLRPFDNVLTDISAFQPKWKVRMNVDHILTDEDNLERVPMPYRTMRNLSLLLETAATRARREATTCPSLVVPQFYNGKVQYLLPLCLDDPTHTDLVMALQPMEGGYYLCSTCLTPEMAYCNARLLGRPTAPWLVALVQ